MDAALHSRSRLLPILLAFYLPGLGALGWARGWVWAVLAGIAVVGATVTQVMLWRAAEVEEERTARVAAELAAATEHALHRKAMGDLLVTLARRNQALLERQLALIDALEQEEHDPDALSNLFRLDHFATRMRRNAESLLVLSGNEPSRRWHDPLPASEVVRGAVAEVEDYTRVDVRVPHEVAVVGHAVSDVAHLLAELIENATAFSPPDTLVAVNGRDLLDGFEVRVEDFGLGIAEADLAGHNYRLSHPVDLDTELSRTLGLLVVARLAARHGISVCLERNGAGGTTALVRLPAALVAGPLPSHLAHRSPPPSTQAAPSPALTPSSAANARQCAEPARGGFCAPQVQAPIPDYAGLRPAGEGPRLVALAGGVSVVTLAATLDHPAESDRREDGRHDGADRFAHPAGLARRIPQAHLAAEFVGQSPAPPPVPPPTGLPGTRPEDQRARLSSFQSGLVSGRKTSARLFAVQDQNPMTDDDPTVEQGIR